MIDRTTAGILNILLGNIGVGHFYTGQILRGILDIILAYFSFNLFLSLSYPSIPGISASNFL